VVCLTQAGAFDSDCGVNGWTYLPTLNSDIYADDVVVTADDAILLSGMSESIDPAPMVMRLDPTGGRDNNFGSSGTWLGTGLTGRMYSLAIQADGRILSAGNDEEIGLSSVIVIRLNNTITPQSTTVPTTTTAIATTTIPVTTIAANQLPATGHDENGLLFAVGFFGIGFLLMGLRRRALR
jgi:LPXTG-motif cell wall-anchored protein